MTGCPAREATCNRLVLQGSFALPVPGMETSTADGAADRLVGGTMPAGVQDCHVCLEEQQ